jgi:putative mRNA 3-end processing factor
MSYGNLLEMTDSGLYCRAGDFFIDPWRPVERAVITHCHSDHAHWGMDSYLVARAGERVLTSRLGDEIRRQPLEYGETVSVNGPKLSLHPAGHILGSAQVRIEHMGEVWVVSGDYKVDPDPTCAAFEPLKCHTFITESTFGLPIFNWRPQPELFEDINTWWHRNHERGQTSIIYAYALGKAQRLIAGLDYSIGPIFTHGAVEKFNHSYRDSGVHLPLTRCVGETEHRLEFAGALVIAPPSAGGTGWVRKFVQPVTAFASGWMQIRGNRRRRAVDRGFVLSDHADWTGLLETIQATGAETIWVTHGYTAELVRWLQEKGLDAREATTRFGGEGDDGED